MITVLSYLEKLNNIPVLQEEFHSQAAFHSEEDWRYFLYTKLEDLRKALKAEPVLDILCWNVSGKQALAELEQTRKKYMEAFLLLIADSSISPMEYLRPSILPTALLLSPFDRLQCSQVLGELISSYCSQFKNKEDEDTFLIETREGRQRVPLSQISFVEARDKKIYICTRSESFGFYETIDHMSELLPAPARALPQVPQELYRQYGKSKKTQSFRRNDRTGQRRDSPAVQKLQKGGQGIWEYLN